MNFGICGGPRINSTDAKRLLYYTYSGNLLHLNFISKQMVKREIHSVSDPNPSNSVRWICKSTCSHYPRQSTWLSCRVQIKPARWVLCLMKQHRGKVKHGEILGSECFWERVTNLPSFLGAEGFTGTRVSVLGVWNPRQMGMDELVTIL